MILKQFIANLPFSPAVAGQVGFYTKRLAREEFTRRLGVIFMLTALLIQSLALISPPQATIAAGPNNIIFQGITSKEDLLQRFDGNDDGNGHNDLQEIFASFGISRNDLAGGEVAKLNSRDQNLKLWSVGRHPYNKPGEYSKQIQGASTEVYVRPLWSWDSGSFGSNYQALSGTTSDGRYFAVLFSCGNLVFNIDEEETPKEPVGFVQHDCEAIMGWAQDPNDTTKRTKITLWMRLENEQHGLRKQFVANADSPTSPEGAGYGFKFKLPDELKSPDQSVVYTVVAHDDSGLAKDVYLARNVSYSAPCLEPLPEEDEPNTPALGALTKHQCRCLEGWAYDPDDLNRAVEVRLKLELEDNSVAASDWQYTTASKEKPKIGIGGNRGFKFDIEGADFDQWKSAESATLATVQVKDIDSGEWLTIVEAQVLDPNPCLEKTEQPPQYCEFNESLLADDPRCLECPYQPTLWIDSTDCNEPFALIVRNKTARNVTQDIDDADGTTARPGDIIEYTLTAQNIGTEAATVDFRESLTDVLEYADFVDAPGGEYRDDEQLVEWDSTELGVDETDSRTITVRVKETIPATPASVGDPESYNLTMTNIFGTDRVEIKVSAPASKQIEMVVKELPNTGASTNLLMMGLSGFVALYLYGRNRQLSRELQLVRSEFNLGAA